jgi:hypothetical protein
MLLFTVKQRTVIKTFKIIEIEPLSESGSVSENRIPVPPPPPPVTQPVENDDDDSFTDDDDIDTKDDDSDFD